MRLSTLTPFLATAALTTASTLNVTVLGAQNNKSTLECWALDPGFKTSTTAGTSGTEVLNLGPVGGLNAGNASYSVLPAKFDGGRHNAPALQYVYSINPEAKIPQFRASNSRMPFHACNPT